jgi:translin
MMLENLMSKAAIDLRDREKARDEAYSRARRARMLGKQAILYLHNGDMEKARSNLDEAMRLLEEINVFAVRFKEIGFYEAVTAARQEFAEARILYGLNTSEGYPIPETIDIGYTDYILGLADVPGELRRQTLDLLREGKLKRAEENLGIMEEIYLHLTGMEDASLLLKGLRRKLDVMRSVNERTRAEITTEVSRERLRRRLEEL